MLDVGYGRHCGPSPEVPAETCSDHHQGAGVVVCSGHIFPDAVIGSRKTGLGAATNRNSRAPVRLFGRSFRKPQPIESTGTNGVFESLELWNAVLACVVNYNQMLVGVDPGLAND